MIHPVLSKVAEATQGSKFENQLWVVGGAVRDFLLGKVRPTDLDIVLEGSSSELARFLFKAGICDHAPVVYARFGTAMVGIDGVDVEIVTARSESYRDESRKPIVRPATLHDDALRRDFTINTLLWNLHSHKLFDPLGVGQEDLRNGVLRTPMEPKQTFHDDALRMLRAVRFRWKFNLKPAPGVHEAIRECADRLKVISMERIRDELSKMLLLPSASFCMRELLDLGLMPFIAPELCQLVGVEQGKNHRLDAWDHTMAVLDAAGHDDLELALAALLHDVGKPTTRTVDSSGKTRFFNHEVVGSEMSTKILRRLRYPSEIVQGVALLVRNHMRIYSAPKFSPTAARRLIRDVGASVDKLLLLCEADCKGGKVKEDFGAFRQIRQMLNQVQREAPLGSLKSPLNGLEIMDALGLDEGKEVGRASAFLDTLVLDGKIKAGDKMAALKALKKEF